MKGIAEDKTYAKKDYSISIKKKNKIFKRKYCLYIISLIFVSIFSGYIGGKVVEVKTIAGEKGHKESLVNLKGMMDAAIVNVQPSLVTISSTEENLLKNQYSEGNITGIIVNSRGYIISNLSRIKEYEDIYVKLSQQEKEPLRATFIGGDEDADLALIKIDEENLIPIAFADENKLKEGDLVLAIGNAISDNYVGLITPGIITSRNDEVDDQLRGCKNKVIQTNAIINKYNTGGIICNSEGEMVGLSSMYLSEKFNVDGLYYSLRVDAVKKIVEDLINLTDVLGITGGKVVKSNDSDIEGVYVKSVKEYKPAYNAGILPTDIILRIDGEKVTTIEDIYYIIKARKNGDTIQCDILRDGVETTLDITLIL